MQKGFTLPELLVVLGITALLVSLVVTNVIGIQRKSQIAGATTLLISDLRGQQLRTMVGDNGGANTASASGVYFGVNSYTLFSGASYSASLDKFTVNLNPALQFNNNLLPNSQVVFATLSGEIAGFTGGSSSIDLQDINSSEKKTIKFDKYGTVISVN